MIKCKSYFCLDNDVSQLYNLKVPPTGFELLLEIMDLFDYTNDPKLMRTIKNNIPEDYSYSNFTEEFVNELNKIERTIISGSADKTIRMWDIETGQCLRTFSGHTNWVNSVALFSDNSKMVYGSHDKTIKLWDIETGQCQRTFSGHTKWIYSVALK